MDNYKVMFVDDEYMILEGLKLIVDWSALGFEVVKTAKSATEALDYLKNHTIDLLITDINMPDLSGIELVEKAQKLNKDFFSIILSGYQEFTFVKEGMRLGVKNYLVKPVNKQELQKSVTAIYQELEKQQDFQNQTSLYRETSLVLWLNDELNEADYFQLVKQLPEIMVPPYTPLLLSGDKEVVQMVMQYFLDERQPLQVKIRGEAAQRVLIHHGSRHQLLLMIRQIEQLFAHQAWQLIVGETITEWENLYKSYEKIKQVQSLQNFYPDLLPTEKVLKVELTHQQEFPFLAFNKALTIGDVKTVKQELDKIFEQLLAVKAPPKRVKYFSFLLFNDIYRQFATLTNDDYERVVSEIRTSTTILQLQEILNQTMALAKKQHAQKRYSDTIQQVLVLLNEHYTEELSLKSVGETLHLSVVYLGQLFKKETELSFNQYLNLIRIKKAQHLLIQTNQTINEIAEAVGYNNTNYFSKMFKKLNGLTPKEFREDYREEYDALD